MRVLIACEFSGVVRNAFVAAGHDAMSCDLLPSETERPDGWDGHYQGDVFELLADKSYEFDLMIAHPPCTYLCNSGVRWLYGGKGKVKDKARWANMRLGAKFFKALLDARIPRIAIENPIMHRYAKEIVGREHNQLIQPWQFGHPETKATCLWLKNLPPLKPTKIVDGRHPRVALATPGPDRWKERSRTMNGIAKAMATQWGGK